MITTPLNIFLLNVNFDKFIIEGAFVLGENDFRKSFSPFSACLAVTENIIFQKMTSGWPIFSPLTRKSVSPLIFTSNNFRKKRERERERERERKESLDQREREREKREPRSRRSSDYRTAPTSDAIDEIARHDRRDRAARSMRSRVAIVGARRTHTTRRCDRRIGCISFAGFWFLLPDLMHFL